jgi:serine/threonine protein kinase
MSAWQLIVTSGPDKDSRFPLADGTGHMLGRQQGVAYKLNDPRVSRAHVEIRVEGERVTILDKNSSGGTFVNGNRITEQVLRPRDMIQVGDSQLRFQRAGSDDSASTLAPPRRADDDARATEQLAELTGCTLGHYAIGDVLGKGTSSMVFRATDDTDNKTVALKVMQPSFSKNDEEMQRFVRAMKTMLPLRHPNLVTLHAAGKSGPYCWVAMELVEGESLTQVIQRIGVAGMLDWKHAFRVALQIARALEYAHGQGIIHRNITPANILIRTADKQVKLGDLMLAKALEGTLAQVVTRPGEVLGDVNYLSPERTQGPTAPVDGRSDQFCLGATVYALLTGKAPFAGGNVYETISNIRKTDPVKPTKYQMSIPGLFEGVVLKMLAKSPDDRFPSAGKLVAELERVGRFQGAGVD